jgi:ABC-2 type transport system ATP-binding protein
MDIAIETHELSKQFAPATGWRRLVRQKPITAVDGVSLSVPVGELFGLLGPNGAGKTTLVKMLCTLILPSGGTATIAGYPLGQGGRIRAAVGLVVADERSFYWRLSGRENLLFFAAMYRLYGAEARSRVEEVLAQVEMTAAADQRFSNYSTGMKQRVAIARSLLHRPRILFLDEPSRSLDPTATQHLHHLLRQLVAQQDVTIFLITHDLLEAEKLCDRVAVMHKGRIRITGSPLLLRERLTRKLHYTVRVEGAPATVVERLRPIVPDVDLREVGEYQHVRFTAAESDGTLTSVLDCLRAQGLTIYSIEGAPPSLEEVFRHFTRPHDAGEGATGET